MLFKISYIQFQNIIYTKFKTFFFFQKNHLLKRGVRKRSIDYVPKRVIRSCDWIVDFLVTEEWTVISRSSGGGSRLREKRGIRNIKQFFCWWNFANSLPILNAPTQSIWILYLNWKGKSIPFAAICQKSSEKKFVFYLGVMSSRWKGISYQPSLRGRKWRKEGKKRIRFFNE